jgi:tripartite-type tricarboxylate transporter receptor subunit TctC
MAAAGAVNAQAYPSKPIQMIVPLGIATAADVMMRVVAQKMSENMGQQITVENHPGAAGLVGGERVARAAADGYTLGGFSDTVVNAVPLLYPKVPYDPFTSFEPVSMVAAITFVMFVHPSLPAKNLKEFIAFAKARPGQLDYASGGAGSPMHIAMELFKIATGTSLTHIPYKGANLGVVDVLSGRVPVMITSLATVLSNIRDGKLRSLGVGSPERSSLLPDVPTLSEAGLPGFTYFTWGAIYAPRGTPKPIIVKLNSEAVKAVNDAKVRERLLAMGLEPGSSTPEQLATATRNGHAKMAKVIKEAGIRLD